MLTMSRDLLYYKLHPEVKEPYRATEGSACFDLYSFLQEDKPVKVYLNNFEKVDKKDRIVQNGRVQVNPHERVLIPTGLIFDIPRGYSVRLYPRSSLALKQGLTLANNVGIIDWDYVAQACDADFLGKPTYHGGFDVGGWLHVPIRSVVLIGHDPI